MSINSVNRYTAMHSNELREIRDKFSAQKYDLSKHLSEVRNTVAEKKQSEGKLKKAITSSQSLLESLKSVSKKHGDNATVRLKNDHFKHAQPNNFVKKTLNKNRYQSESVAAVKISNAQGSKISAGNAITALQSKIDSAISRVNKLKTEATEGNQKINSLKEQISLLDTELNKISTVENKAKEGFEKNKKTKQDFFMIYQSNAGCKGINAVARNIYGNGPTAEEVSGSKVVDEYRNAFGYEIFSRGNKPLVLSIKANCSELSELVKKGAKALYTPRENNSTTYRGQGMTHNGIDKLTTQFKADKSNHTETAYKLGQFFSTSTKPSVAKEFANRSHDNVKVLYEVRGNSSNGLSVTGGLSFNNDEGERLYSPLANFKVTDISKTQSGTYHVMLEEVAKVDRAPLLPY